MPLYSVKSNATLSYIMSLLHKYAQTPDEVGFGRVIYNRDGGETDRTLVAIDSALYKRLVSAELSKRGEDFFIREFMSNKVTLPREGYNYNFYIPLPQGIKEEEVLSSLRSKLDFFIRAGDLPHRCYRIIIPKRSRQTDELQGSCFVTFDKRTKESHANSLALVRTALHSSLWPDGQTSVKCFWARERSREEDFVRPKVLPRETTEETQ